MVILKAFVFLLIFVQLSHSVLYAQDSSTLAPVREISVSGNQEIMAVRYGAPYGSIIDLFSVIDGSLINQVDISPNVPEHIAISPTGNQLLWTGVSGELGLYTFNDGVSVFLFPPSTSSSYQGVFWSPTDNSLVAYTQGARVTFYDVDTQQRVGSIVDTTRGTVIDVDFSPDGTQVVTSYLSGSEAENVSTSLLIWDMPDSGNIIDEPTMVADGIGGGDVDWSPDSSRIALIGLTGIAIYNATTDTIEISDLSANLDNPAYSVSWSPDSQYIATGGIIANIWDATTYELVGPLGELPVISEIIWSPDNLFVYTNGRAEDGLLATSVQLMLSGNVELK